MQKKLMLRPTAVPSEHLPSESISYMERPDSPDNTSSSFVSLDQSDSSAHGNLSTPQVVTPNGNSSNLSNIIIASNNNSTNNNNNNNLPTIINNNGNHHHHAEYQEDVKIAENFTYHQSTTPSIVQATNIVTYQPSSYDTLLTPLSTVPYQEITEQPMYMTSDGTEIDQYRLASVLNKDDYGDGTITYVVNFVDY